MSRTRQRTSGNPLPSRFLSGVVPLNLVGQSLTPLSRHELLRAQEEVKRIRVRLHLAPCSRLPPDVQLLLAVRASRDWSISRDDRR